MCPKLHGMEYHLVKGNVQESKLLLQGLFPGEDWDRWISEDARASTYVANHSDIVIWVQDDWVVGDIVHEAFHAMEFTLTSRGITTGGEPYAYYIDWIVTKCLDHLKTVKTVKSEDLGQEGS